MRIKVLSCEKEKTGGYRVGIEYLEKGMRLYPDGKGGQIGDLGTLGDGKITLSQENYLIIDRELPLGEYGCEIDWDRRMDAMENHSGEHLFSALAYLKYGWRTVGFRMSEKYCTLDFDTLEVDEVKVKELELAVNEKIREGHYLCENIYDLERAKEIMGERKEIADKIKGDIRIVSTFPEDFNACAGLHVENTKDVRMFKILSYERVKSTCTRFYFLSGERVYNDYSEKHGIISKLTKLYSCQTDEIVAMSERQLEDKKNLEKKLRTMAGKYGELVSSEIIERPHKTVLNTVGDDIMISLIQDENAVCEAVKKSFQERKLNNHILIAISEIGMNFISESIDMQQLIKFIQSKMTVKGGGNSRSVIIKTDASLEEILKIAEEYLIKL